MEFAPCGFEVLGPSEQGPAPALSQAQAAQQARAAAWRRSVSLRAGGVAGVAERSEWRAAWPRGLVVGLVATLALTGVLPSILRSAAMPDAPAGRGEESWNRHDWHLHLALTGDPTEMLVQWKSRAASGLVEYGRKGAARTYVADASCATYRSEDFCSNEYLWLDFDPGYLCEARLTGLGPDLEYNYQVWDSNRGNHSEVVSFQAAPLPHPEYAFRFVVYGDHGTSERAEYVGRLVEQELARGARLTQHLGDITYATLSTPHQWLEKWEKWLSIVQPYAKRAPYMLVIGNHDLSKDCAVPLLKRFRMPAERSGGNDVFWHSYDFGSLHTVAISSEHDFSRGSPQWSWLAKDLAAVDRSVTPWVVVELHRPIYYSGAGQSDHYNFSISLQRSLEDLLVQHNVDLVLAGHEHAYLRTSRIYKDRADERGPHHFTVGTGGALPYFSGKYAYPDLLPKDWNAFLSFASGYARVSIANSTAMLWEFVSIYGGVEDSVWITRTDRFMGPRQARPRPLA